MSSNNTAPPMVVIGPDGQIQPRVTELDRARTQLDEYRGFLNGSSVSGNNTNAWSEGPRPGVLPYDILPHQYRHPPGPGQEFYRNVTGFHRDGVVHPVDLSKGHEGEGFWAHTTLPSLNSSAIGGVWNETLAEESKGSFDWIGVDKWEMNIKERDILPARSTANSQSSSKVNGTISAGLRDEDWAWVRGTITLHTHSCTSKVDGQREVEYGFYGLHHLPNGTYEIYGVPDGRYLDMRNIPRLYPDHHNITRSIILRELERELEVQEGNLLLTDVRPEDTTTVTRCPILMHFSLPPIPAGTDAADVELYDQELRHPTGLLASLPSPPQYWHRQLNGLGGMGGVIVADQCGVVLGLEGGKGIKLDYFWKKSINYAFLATASQLLVLILLVRQMEITRTPSTLSKVSLWSIVLMGAADSWIFSAHIAVGTMSDNKTSLPLLVPGFLALCTAIIFGPRYAVILYRIQAPERGSDPETPPAAATRPTGAVATDAETAEAGGILASDTPDRSPIARAREYLDERPRLKWIGIAAFAVIILQIVLVPSVLPIFMFALYSFWIPQIWRNATRGTIGVDMMFVLGTSIGRLALPLYALGCPDNVFFIETSPWIWGLVWWQAIQIAILFAQERFGPSFFLPKRFAPPEGYDYHPLLPYMSAPPSPTSPKDLKSLDAGSSAHSLAGTGTLGVDDKTCSICMEEVDTRPSTSLVTAASESLLTGKLGLGQRRTYALAPCGHLFHTACLAQWLAVKTICPLCKRSLPPL